MDFINDIIPLACKWVQQQEGIILSKGSPITPDLLKHAQRLGIKNPNKIRILAVPEIVAPNDLHDPLLRTACIQINFLFPNMAGLTLEYGIYVVAGYLGDQQLLVHELVHVSQYEALGGIHHFLKRYIPELVEFGYDKAPLEEEAQRKTKELLG